MMDARFAPPAGRVSSTTLLLSPVMSRRRKILAWVAILAIALLAASYAAKDYVRAAGFVIRAAGMQGFARTVAGIGTDPVHEERLTVPWRNGQLPARLYRPPHVSQRRILLVPGVHAAGVDEPRLDGFARNLATMGHSVLSVGLPDLARYSITPRTTDMIEDAARWWAAHGEPIGIIGISFGGGLAIVATSRLNDVAWVLSFGGHGDLPRTLRYLCTGTLVDGTHHPAHDYGVVIILLGVADRLVPPEQVEPLRTAILTFLEASHLDMTDKTKAAAAFERARTLGASLPEPARTFMTWVNTRDVAKLGPALLPHAAAMGADPSLSPARTPPPRVPVHLLHGADDNVIPALESQLLAEDLMRRGGLAYQLETPLITHAEVDRTPTPAEIWKLVQFWKRVLAA
jgi:dienelactone hydrolase